MVHTDDHAIWELTSGKFQKQPVVVHKDQFKTVACSDYKRITGMMRCVTNSFSHALPKHPCLWFVRSTIVTRVLRNDTTHLPTHE